MTVYRDHNFGFKPQSTKKKYCTLKEITIQ